MAITENIIDELDNGGFVPTVEWMSQKYDEMNEKLFDGRLDKCYFEITTTGKGSKSKRLGYFYMNATIKANRYTRRMYVGSNSGLYINKNNFFQYCKPTIGLNGNVSRTEKSALSTLVHEMCHYYTYMNGYAPKQGHGPEFKNVAAYVNRKSNGIIFPIQTTASAEESAESEWSDEIKAAKEKRQSNKMEKRIVLAIFKVNDKIRLVNTSSKSLIDNILNIEKHATGNNKCIKVVMSKDMELKKKLNDLGFRSDMTQYRFWDLDKWPESKRLINDYKGWETLYTSDDEDEINPASFEPTEKPKSDPNLIKSFTFKTTDGNIFKATNVTIEQLKEMLKSKFPNWSDAAIENLVSNEKYMVRESIEDRIRKMVREELNNIKSVVENNEDSVITITPDMDLSNTDLM